MRPQPTLQALKIVISFWGDPVLSASASRVAKYLSTKMEGVPTLNFAKMNQDYTQIYALINCMSWEWLTKSNAFQFHLLPSAEMRKMWDNWVLRCVAFDVAIYQDGVGRLKDPTHVPRVLPVPSAIPTPREEATPLVRLHQDFTTFLRLLNEGTVSPRLLEVGEVIHNRLGALAGLNAEPAPTNWGTAMSDPTLEGLLRELHAFAAGSDKHETFMQEFMQDKEKAMEDLEDAEGEPQTCPAEDRIAQLEASVQELNRLLRRHMKSHRPSWTPGPASTEVRVADHEHIQGL